MTIPHSNPLERKMTQTPKLSAGYSGTPLAKKLGLKPRGRIRVIDAPMPYFDLVAPAPEGLILDEESKSKKDVIHIFVRQAKGLPTTLAALKDEILPNGAIWVSWPKKSAKLVSDVDENLVRKAALAVGLVDIKVCAVDETWSGLKLVIPVKDR
jgi:hypothetical protein